MTQVIKERQRAEGRRQKGFIPSPDCPNRLRDGRSQGFKTPTKLKIWYPGRVGFESPSERNLLTAVAPLAYKPAEGCPKGCRPHCLPSASSIAAFFIYPFPVPYLRHNAYFNE
jgi:hypothetical protein